MIASHIVFTFLERCIISYLAVELCGEPSA
jgi:hypothetical protein